MYSVAYNWCFISIFFWCLPWLVFKMYALYFFLFCTAIDNGYYNAIFLAFQVFLMNFINVVIENIMFNLDFIFLSSFLWFCPPLVGPRLWLLKMSWPLAENCWVKVFFPLIPEMFFFPPVNDMLLSSTLFSLKFIPDNQVMPSVSWIFAISSPL